MNITIRPATPDDISGIYALVKELAEYEHAAHEVTATEELYHQCLEDGTFMCIVADIDGQIVGICIYYMTFSTWKGKMLYLEDFVVRQSHRQHGIGQLLFDSYLATAKSQGCALAKWQVLDWNEPAIKFYEKNGAIIEKEWWNGKIIF